MFGFHVSTVLALTLTPPKANIEAENETLESRRFLFQITLFRFYVKRLGSISRSKLSPQALSKAKILTRDDSVVDDAGWYLAKWLSDQMLQDSSGHSKQKLNRILQKAFGVVICWTQIQRAIGFYQRTLMTPPLLHSSNIYVVHFSLWLVLSSCCHIDRSGNSDLHKTCPAWHGKGREDMHWKY